MAAREEYRAYVTLGVLDDIVVALDNASAEVQAVSIEQLEVMMEDDSASSLLNRRATLEGVIYESPKSDMIEADIAVCMIGSGLFGNWVVSVTAWDFGGHRAIELEVGVDVNLLASGSLQYPIAKVNWNKSQQKLIQIENILRNYFPDLQRLKDD